jgi:hypothetical protein
MTQTIGTIDPFINLPLLLHQNLVIFDVPSDIILPKTANANLLNSASHWHVLLVTSGLLLFANVLRNQAFLLPHLFYPNLRKTALLILAFLGILLNINANVLL